MKITLLSRNRKLYSTRRITEAAEQRGHEILVIEGFMGAKADISIQEFIKEAGGSDLRCFVIDGKVVAAMKRQGVPGEFRSKLHRGAT